MKTRMISAMLVCLCWITLRLEGQAQNPAPSFKEEPQFSVGYLYQGSQPALGNGRFGMNGGRADVLFPLRRHFGLVGEFSGAHTNSVPGAGTGLTLVTYMAGPRFSMPLRRGGEAHPIVPFAQLLLGGVHGSEGLFPHGSTMSNSANSFAMSAGGGLQVGMSRRLSLRLVQAEYLYTRLPNLFDNYQNSYRIGAGLVLRLR